MLRSTFQHIEGIGKKKERILWNSGILSWDALIKKLEYKNKQLDLFSDFPVSVNSLVEEKLFASQKAMDSQDAEFFAKSLPSQEYYRIALSFPTETLFLDIETTGLSRYYDLITMIGWSFGVGNNYNYYVKDISDESPLRAALSKAKVIVTFNGSLFDIPFVKQEFPDLAIPLTHIDLRFFAKSVGLSGGQKAIEDSIGLQRLKETTGMSGKDAPLLWYRYCRGDLNALKLLVRYNYDDMLGMKKIFDVVVNRRLEKEPLPYKENMVIPFYSNLPNDNLELSFISTELDKNIQRQAPKFEPAIMLHKLASTNKDLPKIVGIDLTGSEERLSGWCFLDGDIALTKRIGSDQALIESTLQVKPLLVSIDSPLSIPKGRLSVYDSDPGRRIYGIIDLCERILKKRGVNVYPALINSMQNLTARGMRLANTFRSLGIPVIESYPGAAQDIIRIPRKGASMELLQDGLADFGIKGDIRKLEISHDELDAATSALVGFFFWMGTFEAIGNSDENYLIIPDLSSKKWSKRIVIGLSGSIAAGKTTAAKYLENNGFHYLRFSKVLEEILHTQGIKPDRNSLQKLGEEIYQSPGQRWLCYKLIENLPDGLNVVIDGLRHPDDHAFFVEAFGPEFTHIHVEAPDILRQERYLQSDKTLQEFLDAIQHPVEANVNKLKSLANKVVKNSADIQQYIKKISNIADKTKKNV